METGVSAPQVPFVTGKLAVAFSTDDVAQASECKSVSHLTLGWCTLLRLFQKEPEETSHPGLKRSRHSQIPGEAEPSQRMLPLLMLKTHYLSLRVASI